MKNFYLFCMALLACTTILAQTNISSANPNGTWSNTANWKINGAAANRNPMDGDVIVIEENADVTVTENVNLKNAQIRVYGKLKLQNNTEISLNGNSVVVVYSGGTIEGLQGNAANGQNRNQKITLSGTTIYSGQTVSGPAIATTASPSFSAPLTPLPVKFLGFSVARQNNDVLVQWSTAEEVNSLSFEVERSTDGTNWKRIATVGAKGTSNTVANYSYTDRQVTAPIAYYRIRQADIDGKFTYTAIRSVKNVAGAPDVKIAAINSRVVLQFSAPVKNTVEVRLVSLSGQVVSKQLLHNPVGQVVLNNLPVKGSYIVAISNAADLNVARQVIL